MPYSRPKLSDFYTLSQTKLPENHTLHSSTYIYRYYIHGSAPPSRGQRETTTKFTVFLAFLSVWTSTCKPKCCWLEYFARCIACGKLLTAESQGKLRCVPNRMMVNHRGKVSYVHSRWDFVFSADLTTSLNKVSDCSNQWRVSSEGVNPFTPSAKPLKFSHSLSSTEAFKTLCLLWREV